MSVASASQAGVTVGASPGSGSLADRLVHPAFIVKSVALLVAFAAVFHAWFTAQHRFSSSDGDWSHAYLVPIVSLYLLWQARQGLIHAPLRVFWPALVPLLLSMVCYVFFLVGVPNHMAQGWSAVLAVFSTTLLLAGPEVMRYAFLPIGYLLFGITVSERIMIEITFGLQLLASQGSYILLNMIGVSTDLAGNTLTVYPSGGAEPIPLNVAEACSGMRMLIAFLALGVAVALVGCRYWWQRVALVILAAPVALLINIFRVAFLGVASLYDRDFATGQAHMLIGTLWLIPGFLLYMLIVWALNKSVREAPAAAPATGASKKDGVPA